MIHQATSGEWSVSAIQLLKSKPENSLVEPVHHLLAPTVTQLRTTSQCLDWTSLELSVSSTGTEPTAHRRPTGSVLVQTGSITSTVPHRATLDVPPVTTTHTPPPIDGVDLHSVPDITDAWHPPVRPPTR